MSDQDATSGRTSEIQMIATHVVQNQANVCRVIMDGIKKEIEELNTKLDKLMPLTTDVAVLKQRLTIVAAISSSLPVIVVLLYELLKR